jgi:glycosyltransferase involved in cell wall biosynthesis
LHASRTANHIAKKHSVAFLYERPIANQTYDFSNSAIQYIPIKTWNLGLIYLLIGLVQVFRLGRKYDLVHAHTALSPMVLGWLISVLMGCPLIVTAHGSDVRHYGRTRIRFLQKAIFHFSSLWTCVSSEIKNFLVSSLRFSKSKLVVIRNGFDDNLLKFPDVPSSVLTICSVGSLRAVKNPMMLIEIVDSLRASGIKTTLHIIGDGPLHTQLQNVIDSQSLSDDIKLLGAKPHSETMALLAASHIFLMTSIQEGFPIALMEAMALAKVVVVPRVGGIPEIVSDGENGFLFDPSDVKGAIKLISRIMQSSSLSLKLGMAARESVRHLGWSSIANEYESTYVDLLSNLASNLS